MKNYLKIASVIPFLLVGCGSGDNNATFESSNTKPVIDVISSSTSNNQTLNLILPKSDVDGDTLTYQLASSPLHGEASFNGNVFSYTPELNFSGIDKFSYIANDGTVDSDSKEISIISNINFNNTIPSISGIIDSVNKNITLITVLQDRDIDGDILSYSVVSGPSNGSVQFYSNILTYTPNTDFVGSDTFTFKANDGLADSPVVNADITINNQNNAPLIFSSSIPDGIEGAGFSHIIAIEDPDGDSLTKSVEVVDSLGNSIATPTWLSIDSVNGILSSDLIDLNTDSIVYLKITATDSFGLSSTIIYPWNIIDYSPFVTTWDTANVGDSDNNTVAFYTELNPYNVIDWGDGTIEINGQNGEKSHTYSVSGVYEISIMGIKSLDINGIHGGPINRSKLLTIENWGSSKWISMADIFRGAASLVCNATDYPDVSNVFDMGYAFNGAVAYNCPMDDWDVSNVIFMDYTFYGASSFNQPLSNWDTGNVETMYAMFRYSPFNQDIGNWDVGRVNTFAYSFANTPFNYDINNWNTSSATTFGRMFESAAFNQPIGNWDVSNATSISYMFYNNWQFNQDISSWDVSNVTSFAGVFYSTNFNQDISSWNVSSGTSFDSMFRNAQSFNQDLSSWDITNGIDLDYMFYQASLFDQDISSWTPINATNMLGMLTQSSFSTTNYDLLLNAWSLLALQSNVSFSAASTNYTTAISDAARTDIITNFTWTITDAGGI